MRNGAIGQCRCAPLICPAPYLLHAGARIFNHLKNNNSGRPRATPTPPTAAPCCCPADVARLCSVFFGVSYILASRCIDDAKCMFIMYLTNSALSSGHGIVQV